MISLPVVVVSLDIDVVSFKTNDRSPMVPDWFRVEELVESVSSVYSPVMELPEPVRVMVAFWLESPETFRSVLVSERSSDEDEVVVDELVYKPVMSSLVLLGAWLTLSHFWTASKRS